MQRELDGHLLTDEGLTYLARRDRAAVGPCFNRWGVTGVFERMAADPQREVLAEVDLDLLALDSTVVKFYAPGTGAPENRSARRSDARAEA